MKRFALMLAVAVGSFGIASFGGVATASAQHGWGYSGHHRSGYTVRHGNHFDHIRPHGNHVHIDHYLPHRGHVHVHRQVVPRYNDYCPTTRYPYSGSRMVIPYYRAQSSIGVRTPGFSFYLGR